jgi:hypothetical protein
MLKPQPPQPTHLLLDISGSTGGCGRYYQYALEVFNRLARTGPVTVYVWDDSIRHVSNAQFIEICGHCCGGGGTYPHVMAPTQYTPDRGNIVIITDGDISDGDANRCIRDVGGRAFSSVEVHFVKTGGRMSLRVSAAFTGNCDRVSIFTHDGATEMIADCSTRDVDTLIEGYFGRPVEFIMDLPQIRGAVTLYALSNDTLPLRNRILDLQKNLMAHIAKTAGSRDWAYLTTLLNERDFPQAIDAIRQYTIGDNIAAEIKSGIEDLIRLCTTKDFSIANLRAGTSRLARADTIAATIPDNAPITPTFECPIYMHDDTATITVYEGAPVLDGLDPSYLDYLTSNPLALLDNKDLCNKLRSRIGHPIGLGAAKALFANNPLCPFTRKPLSCVITLECVLTICDQGATNTPLLPRGNLYAIANLLFGKKLVGNPALWYAVVWRVMESIPHLADTLPLVERFLVQYWTRETTNITLSGLPIAPMIKAPVGISMWYCIVSEYVREDPETNRLRGLGAASKHLLPCLDLLGYYYPQAVHERMDIFTVHSQLMQAEKKNLPWRIDLRSCIQKSHVAGGRIILLDGPAQDPAASYNRFRELYCPATTLSVGKLFAVANYVDRTKTAGVIHIPMALDDAAPLPVTNYTYPEMTLDDITSPIEICPETVRPYVMKEHIHWKEHATRRYGSISGQCSNYKYFIDYVFAYDSYPTADQLHLFIADRQSRREVSAMDTVPEYQVEFIDGVIRDYKNITETLSVREFKARAWASMREVDRARIDRSK